LNAARVQEEESVKVSEMEARGSKTLVASEPMKQPSWLMWTVMKGCRLVLLTLLWAGLGMGAGLFCGIVGLVIASAMAHRTPDMTMAYREISIPVAMVSGSCAFVWNLGRTIQAALLRGKVGVKARHKARRKAQ
jgi:hypothetical protein